MRRMAEVSHCGEQPSMGKRCGLHDDDAAAQERKPPHGLSVLSQEFRGHLARCPDHGCQVSPRYSASDGNWVQVFSKIRPDETAGLIVTTRWHVGQAIGTHCSMDSHSLSPEICDLNIKTTRSTNTESVGLLAAGARAPSDFQHAVWHTSAPVLNQLDRASRRATVTGTRWNRNASCCANRPIM